LLSPVIDTGMTSLLREPHTQHARIGHRGAEGEWRDLAVAIAAVASLVGDGAPLRNGSS
jgi:hypothetical protein